MTSRISTGELVDGVRDHFGDLVDKLDVLAVECAPSRLRRRRIGGSSG
jgi:hypothetical protein